MKGIIFVGIFIVTLFFSSILVAEKSVNTGSIEILPSDYGKFGLTPFVGPVSDEGTQETTLIFNQFIHGREVTKVELLFFSSKKNLILVNQNDFKCEREKCFITFDIIPDYQYNIEFEFVYGKDQPDTDQSMRAIRYRVKDIGLLTGRVNRKHK